MGIFRVILELLLTTAFAWEMPWQKKEDHFDNTANYDELLSEAARMAYGNDTPQLRYKLCFYNISHAGLTSCIDIPDETVVYAPSHYILQCANKAVTGSKDRCPIIDEVQALIDATGDKKPLFEECFPALYSNHPWASQHFLFGAILPAIDYAESKLLAWCNDPQALDAYPLAHTKPPGVLRDSAGNIEIYSSWGSENGALKPIIR